MASPKQGKGLYIFLVEFKLDLTNNKYIDASHGKERGFKGLANLNVCPTLRSRSIKS